MENTMTDTQTQVLKILGSVTTEQWNVVAIKMFQDPNSKAVTFLPKKVQSQLSEMEIDTVPIILDGDTQELDLETSLKMLSQTKSNDEVVQETIMALLGMDVEDCGCEGEEDGLYQEDYGEDMYFGRY